MYSEPDAHPEIRPVGSHLPDEAVLLVVLVDIAIAGLRRDVLGELPVVDAGNT
jgi:hypothetical protein